MSTVRHEQDTGPGRRFHQRFMAALLAAIVVIVANVVAGSWQYFAGPLPAGYDLASQSLGVLLFTFSAIAIMHLGAEAKSHRFDTPGWLTALEKKVFLVSPWLPKILLWAVMLSLVRFREHDAAIFLMAVVAIYVAAEHLGGLHEHRELLAAQRKMLDDYRTDLASLANATGMEHGRDKLYEAYSASKEPILAVIKFFDIDREWFVANGKLGAYKKTRRTRTFFNALEHAPEVLFVAGLGLPVTRAGPGAPGPGETELADQFQNLLGLAWQWWMLHEIATGRPADKPCLFRIRIASTSNWIHVANGHVYQLIEGRVLSENKVRDLTIDIDKKAESLASLLTWAESEIRRNAQLGCSGEEYLCTTFCRLLHTIDTYEFAKLTKEGLVHILTQLGMEDWIAKKADYVPGLVLDDAHLRSHCHAIFDHFLKIVTTEGTQAVTLSRAAAQARGAAWNGLHVADTVCPVTDIAAQVL